MKSLELFAGAGGLAMGVRNAGLNHALVVEWDHDACEALRENFGETLERRNGWPIVERDVATLNFKSYSDTIDILAGGPPCQPFSIGGKHQGFDDKRDMFPAAVRAVRETRPKAFIFENVRGLLRRSFSQYFNYILLQLTYPELEAKEGKPWEEHLAMLERHHTHGKMNGLFYRVVPRLVNAADYGVPQKRERIFIVGFRSDIQQEWSFPETSHSEHALFHSKWVSGDYWDEHRISEKHRPNLPEGSGLKLRRLMDSPPRLSRWRTVRDVICDLPKPSLRESKGISNHTLQLGARSYAGHTGSPLDESAKTLKAGDHGVPGGENMLLSPDGSVRYFTVRESARLQTFPDDYVFPGSWTESMRQIGNAVPVLLGTKVAESVAEVLRNQDRRMRDQN